MKRKNTGDCVDSVFIGACVVLGVVYVALLLAAALHNPETPAKATHAESVAEDVVTAKREEFSANTSVYLNAKKHGEANRRAQSAKYANPVVTFPEYNDDKDDDKIDNLSAEYVDLEMDNQEITDTEAPANVETKLTPETAPYLESESYAPTETSPTDDSGWCDAGEFRITAYCACETCCGGWSDGITATGTVATQGRTIAVDPAVIPLGSEVEINGNVYIAEDTGVSGNTIDIYMDSHAGALEWGVQTATINYR